MVMSGAGRNNSRWWKGAMYVTAAAFTGKVLSALYRVPYQNMAGDQGLYVYQQVYPLLGTAMITAMYGFPVALSGMMMERGADQKPKEAEETARAAFVLLLLVHGFLFGALAFTSPFIASWMGDPDLTNILRLAGLVLLFVPFISMVRGYYQGIGQMQPAAVSHLVEQVIRSAAIIGFTALVVCRGLGPYAAGRAAAAASVLGAAACAGYLFVVWRRRDHRRGVLVSNVIQRMKDIRRTFLLRGLLAASGAMIFLLYQWVDAFTVVRLLMEKAAGSEQAKALKGMFDRGQPLLQFGTVLATSFAMTVVPLIQKEKNTGNEDQSASYAGFALRLTLFSGSAAAAGLIMIAEPVNIMLFENQAGTGALRILAAALLFSGIIMITSAVMQGHYHFLRPVLFLGLGAAVKTFGNLVLVPVFGIRGAAAATVLGMAVTAGCSSIEVFRHQAVRLPSRAWIGKLAASLALMVTMLVITDAGFDQLYDGNSRLYAACQALTSAAAGVVLQAVLVKKWDLFTKEERMHLPVFHHLDSLLKRKGEKV
ncbi:putative polysaccharide biosynthesis protein [Salibacterium halotolerans]|uniref:Polysaccharide transporter, PST family n=1 Tax=Salibacterium halotolerans TaxID=1884432 RepID=A0A1I5WLE2_9BACI|nr:polysaccharide biosynthesis protein [Salibacterium halotolerans]SFQ20585.1 polysaccharide transporter, PST family [Salibacterium halotolerans]